MLRLDENKIKCIYLYPPDDALIVPDIIIFEDDPKKLMWIAPSYTRHRW